MGKKSTISHSEKAELEFPVARIQKHLLAKARHNYMGNKVKVMRVPPTSAVYLGGVLEFFCSEILEAASSHTIVKKKKRITPNNIMFAMRENDELNKILAGATAFIGSTLSTAVINEATKIPEDLKKKDKKDKKA
jgi:histone H2A